MKAFFNSIPGILVILGCSIAVLVVMHYVFKHFIRKSDKIHMRFTAKLFNLVVLILVIGYTWGYFDPNMNIQSIMLKGSALVVAILGFAAQPAIADLICGLLISFNKPFEIGDYIIPEGMDPGVVEDITLRHTVLRIYDDLRVIVPNSVLNSKTVTNASYRSDRKGVHLTYSVSYDTDVPYAMDTIRDCVADSPYTLGIETNGIKEDSGPVYFMKFGDSALLLETTIWLNRDANGFIATTDVNNRVIKAFRERGIEIPYNFVNVVERDYVESNVDSTGRKKKSSPSKRNYRSDTIDITSKDSNIENALEVVRHFATRQRLDARATKQIELMAEEAIGIMKGIVNDSRSKFWVEGSGLKYKMHLRFALAVGSEEYKKLMALSTSGRNEAVHTLAEKIWERMIAGVKSTGDSADSNEDYEWSIHDNPDDPDSIGESILAAIADDIKVSVTKDRVELIVLKSTHA